MERVVKGQLTVRQGARLLNLGERQVKRLNASIYGPARGPTWSGART